MEEISFDSLQPTCLRVRDLAQVYPQINLWSCLCIHSVLKQPVIWHSIKSQIICFNWRCSETFGKIWDPFILFTRSGKCNLKLAIIVECQIVMESLKSNATLRKAADPSPHPGSAALICNLAWRRNTFWKGTNNHFPLLSSSGFCFVTIPSTPESCAGSTSPSGTSVTKIHTLRILFVWVTFRICNATEDMEAKKGWRRR